mmetsp:Transcript_43419/g.128450  ORF Transcript_43419/g.128450 Transcript_43419/m.128450 type:complete len:321 (-) Transcript_43419:49-1011(-)
MQRLLPSPVPAPSHHRAPLLQPLREVRALVAPLLDHAERAAPGGDDELLEAPRRAVEREVARSLGVVHRHRAAGVGVRDREDRDALGAVEAEGVVEEVHVRQVLHRVKGAVQRPHVLRELGEVGRRRLALLLGDRLDGAKLQPHPLQIGLRLPEHSARSSPGAGVLLVLRDALRDLAQLLVVGAELVEVRVRNREVRRDGVVDVVHVLGVRRPELQDARQVQAHLLPRPLDEVEAARPEEEAAAEARRDAPLEALQLDDGGVVPHGEGADLLEHGLQVLVARLALGLGAGLPHGRGLRCAPESRLAIAGLHRARRVLYTP